MIYARIILIATIVLLCIYYAMLMGQLWGKWKITYRKITFIKSCIPFFYWIVSQKNKHSK